MTKKKSKKNRSQKNASKKVKQERTQQIKIQNQKEVLEHSKPQEEKFFSQKTEKNSSPKIQSENSKQVKSKSSFGLLSAIGKFLKFIFKTAFILLLLGVLTTGGIYLIYGRDLPDVRQLKDMDFAQTTHIYDRKGHELYSIYKEKREYVKLKDISPLLINATIAIEDKKFYQHPGIDPVGMVRAQLRNFQDDGISQGASTITQQLARNIFLSPEKSYERKIREMILSLQMESFFKKDEILELYLNKISYGSNIYGVEAAAQTYFGVSAKDLTLVQASILAALPKAPGDLLPYGSKVKELMGYCKTEEDSVVTQTQVIDDSEASPSEDEMNLIFKLKAQSQVWVRVIIDGKKEEITMKPNEEKIFRAKEKIDFVPANNKIEAFLNDQKLKSITPNKLQTFTVDNWITMVEEAIAQNANSGNQPTQCQLPSDDKYIFGRKDYVLERMVIDKYITEEERIQAWKEGFKVKFKPQQHKIDQNAPHFVFYVKSWLEEKYGKEMVESGGLQVTTTLDPDLQKIAKKAIDDNIERNLRYGANNAALVALDPKNGQVLAMVGSRDYWNKEIDGQVNIALSLRQPGSSFKPYAYAAAIEREGIGSGTHLNDYKTVFNKKDMPRNYDGKYQGSMTIRNALGGSRNIPAIKAYYVAGEEEQMLNFVDKLGLTSLRTFRDEFNKDAAKRGWTFYYGWPMAIGSGEVRLIDHVAAYGAFANQGKLAPAIPVLEVRDRDGNVIDKFDGSKAAKQVMDPQVAYIISSMLSDVYARPAGSWRALLTITGHNVAAKTGTSNKKLGNALYPNNDWTMAYTPSLVAGVWVGNTDGKHLRSGAYSLYTTDPIYKQFFTDALKDKPREEFPKPEGLIFKGREVYPSWWNSKKNFDKQFKRVGGDPVKKPTDPNKPADPNKPNTPGTTTPTPSAPPANTPFQL